MGIGLSLVKEFVGLHGGRVEARSDGPGKGSEFIVRLPISAVTPAESPAVSSGNPPGPGRRVLVVDDNKDAADTLAGLLGLMGHEARVTYAGAAGVAEAVEFRPDLVLVDLGMPGMDGFETARRIRAAKGGAEPLLVALTGWGSEEDRRRTRDAGFDRHLVKPVQPSELASLLVDIPR
jgi:CheY-like chemotaxis protein